MRKGQVHSGRLLTACANRCRLHGNQGLKVIARAVAATLGRSVPLGKKNQWLMLREFYNAFTFETKLAAHTARRGKVRADVFNRSLLWRRVRMTVLSSRGARCECCGTTPKDGAVMHVDHIKPRSKYPELALSVENLQVLCEACNFGKGTWDETDWRAQ